jgi:hypothetical protein
MKDFMVIAIGIVVVFALYVSSKSASRRMGRIEKSGLAVYVHRARCEEAFPFDYLSR